MTNTDARRPRRIRRLLTAHPRLAAAAGVTALAVGVVGVVVFQPHKLFIDDRVDEPFPVITMAAEAAGDAVMAEVDAPPPTAPPAAAMAPPDPPAEPAVVSSSAFVSLGHATTGSALIIEAPDGQRTLRLENLDTSNGPELLVVLSDRAVTDDRRSFQDGDYVVLGPLAGNIGSSNYAIPPDVDLERFNSVVVWCEPFAYGFGAAPL